MFNFLRKLFGMNKVSSTEKERIHPTFETPTLSTTDIVDEKSVDVTTLPHAETDAQVEKKAYITFEFDNEMHVSISTGIPAEFIPTLISKNVIQSDEYNNEVIIHYAMLALAFDVSDQMLRGINATGDTNNG